MIAAAKANSHSNLRTGAETLGLAREVLRIEAAAVSQMEQRVDGAFAHAVDMLLACSGRVVVSGIGKSGHIARKVAATFASTGTAAFFVHPAEAGHGDLGMITGQDVVVAFSNSGETAELMAILPAVKRLGANLIALTGNPGSTLAKLADAHIHTGVDKEACPLNLAPTASTTAQLAMGDALAVAVLDARGFGAEDFARSHPGGALGSRLLTRVRDVMRSGPAVPTVSIDATLPEAVLEVSAKRIGMTAVLARDGGIAGVFTDGDLRRALVQGIDFNGARIGDVMTANPALIQAEALAAEAVHLMEARKVNQLLVVDPDGRLIGALNMHDLFHAKAV
jgi:arabinose-5-phosphate isomerase